MVRKFMAVPGGYQRLEDEGERRNRLINHAVMIARFLVVVGMLSIVIIMISMPLLAFTPEGFYQDGMFNFISNGFRKHNWQASLIFSTAEACVGFVRTVGILLYVDYDKEHAGWRTVLCLALLPITLMASIMTMRIDDAPDYHLWYAAVWIITGWMFHLMVTSFNSNFSKENVGPYSSWCPLISKGIVTVGILAGIEFGSAMGKYVADHNNGIQNLDAWLAAGIGEYITAETLAANDFLLAYTIFTHVFFT